VLKKAELQHFKAKLEAERDRVSRAILRRVRRISNEGDRRDDEKSGRDFADGEDVDEFGDALLYAASSEREQLYEIEQALKRIEDGTYGICEVTGKPIGRARLEAIPTARLSIEAQEAEDARYTGSRWQGYEYARDRSDDEVEDED
jgi:DnaK suppressor protein